MSPLDKIEKGILTGDWECVTDAYETLTSKKLNPPQASSQLNIGDAVTMIVKEVFGQGAKISESQIPIETEKENDNTDTSETEVIEKEDDEEDDDLDLGMIKTDKVGIYGNKSVLISDANTPQEDIDKALKKKKKRVTRKPKKVFNVKCQSCSNNFDSHSNGSEQTCPKCVKNKARELRG